MRIGRRGPLKRSKLARLDRPIVWSLLYLLMIPAFAFIYVSTADLFFQTSATHETSYLANKFFVGEAAAFAAGSITVNEALTDFKKQPEGAAPTAQDVTVSGSDILVTLALFSPKAKGSLPVQVAIPMAQVPSNPTLINGYIHVPYSLRSLTGVVIALSADDGYALFQEYSTTTSHPYLAFGPNHFKSLREMIAASEGLVGGLPDQFSRMLYFSAVTATTLGFGDIAPVNVLSRTLVTLEAVLGVVFAGLFLNAIARRRVSEREAPDRSSSPLPDRR